MSGPLAESLVLLAVAPARFRMEAPALDELLAAADLGDEWLAGGTLPSDLYGAIRARAGTRRGRRSDRTVHAMMAAGRLRVERRRRFGLPVEHVDLFDRATRAELVGALDDGLRHASTVPPRLGLLAALASTGGLTLAEGTAVAAQDVASGAVQLVADPTGAIPALADGLRQAVDALA